MMMAMLPEVEMLTPVIISLAVSFFTAILKRFLCRKFTALHCGDISARRPLVCCCCPCRWWLLWNGLFKELFVRTRAAIGRHEHGCG